MKIPNEEVISIYQNTIMDWCNQEVRRKDFSAFYKALRGRDTDAMERLLSESLMETISFYDYKESYYHGFLAGLLNLMQD